MIRLFFVFLIILSSPIQASDTMARIMKDGVIRCGYVVFEPGMRKDTASGKLSGHDHDVMAAVAQRLDLKVAYAAEAGWGTFTADLQTKKYDALCSASWVNPKIGKFVLFSRPLHFESLYLIARADDTRFDHDLANANNEKIKFVGLEGDNPIFIAKTDFPKMKIMELPDMTALAQTLVNVATSKADVTIVDKYTFEVYHENNPGKLKIVRPKHPVRVYPASFVFAPEDYLLQGAVNAALDELILDGTIQRINQKYAKYPGVYLDADIAMKK